ncbi:hypothetical protein [Actinophytocola glycyrrhizae]|uniref:Secreted protein n=1 Tax=Actinophytocola glycyrrhizae TaxID=2044873 RepID=A0ABV9RZN2_9PSEU
MLQAVLVWAGAVLAIGLLLVMALGPVIVEIDSWWYERRHNTKKAARVRRDEAPVTRRVVHPVG